MTPTMPTEAPSRSAATPTGVRPFRVAIDRAVVDRILRRVRDTRLPAPVPGLGPWDGGMSVERLGALVEYWVGEYRWVDAEAELNRYPQFLADVGGHTIHFYHVRGSGPDPLPVIFTHGWPGSVYEFLGVVERLAHPERFGGDARDALTLVIPSLPGFGFSERPGVRPLGPVSTAVLWHVLMTDVLGYTRFGVQGGDLGCVVSVRLAHRFPTSVAGLHLQSRPAAAQAAGAAHRGGARVDRGRGGVPHVVDGLLRAPGPHARDRRTRAVRQPGGNRGVDPREVRAVE